MRSWFNVALSLSPLPVLCLAVASPPAPAPSLGQTVWPYFAKNCVACHDAQSKAAGLNLDSLRGAGSVAQSRETWDSVLRKIRTGEMPPKDSPQPGPAETSEAVRKIESGLEQADRAAPVNPGSVTAHRLNRAEYNNTVRDLLGIDLRPADEFPQDDSGYGFDNIGDVLSLSSSQMEKYVAASEKIARVALFGSEPLQPALVRLEASRQSIVAQTTVPARYDATGLNLPNSLHATHRFPVDGEYVFRLGLNGTRPLGSDPLPFSLWIDGKKRRRSPSTRKAPRGSPSTGRISPAGRWSAACG